MPDKLSSLIGIVAALAGNIAISVALNLQKYAHNKLNERAERVDAEQNESLVAATSSTPLHIQTDAQEQPVLNNPSPKYWRDSTWWLGMVLMILGETGNFMAYGFAPASFIAPLGTVALIANAIIAPWALGERFRRQDFFGIMFAVIGAVVVVRNVQPTEEQLSPSDLMELAMQTQFLIYILCTALLAIGLMSANRIWKLQNLVVNLVLVGIFGSYTVLSTKAIATLLALAFMRIFTFSITYLLLTIMIFTGIMQIRYLNHALANFDSTAVIPTQFVLFTISVIVGSAILYHDFEDMSTYNTICFVFGCMLTFIGVFLVTLNRNGSYTSITTSPLSSHIRPSHQMYSPDLESRRPRTSDESLTDSQYAYQSRHQHNLYIPSGSSPPLFLSHLPRHFPHHYQQQYLRQLDPSINISQRERQNTYMASSTYLHPYSASLHSALNACNEHTFKDEPVPSLPFVHNSLSTVAFYTISLSTNPISPTLPINPFICKIPSSNCSISTSLPTPLPSAYESGSRTTSYGGQSFVSAADIFTNFSTPAVHSPIQLYETAISSPFSLSLPSQPTPFFTSPPTLQLPHINTHFVISNKDEAIHTLPSTEYIFSALNESNNIGSNDEREVTECIH